MQISEISPELAQAADVLSDQLRAHLERLALILLPHSARLDRKFSKQLAELGFNLKARSALLSLTAGAAARLLARETGPVEFLEQVEYNGRRLAKLNIPPSRIVEALQEYDQLLGPTLRTLEPIEYANFQWVREQLHFCVILTLNNAYYQVREAETQAFYELSRVELESGNLDELLNGVVDTLVKVCHADAGQLYLLNDQGSALDLRSSSPRKARRGKAILARQMQRLRRPRQIDPQGSTADLLIDPQWKQKFKWCWSIPLTSEGRTAGLMQFGFQKVYEWLPREQELLLAAAERCLMAAEKARLIEDLAARESQIRQLAEHMLHVEEMERRRISRELHDEAGQSLLCMRLQMEMIEDSLPPEMGVVVGRLREVRELTERTILEMRRLIAALSPAVLEQLGLGAALRQLVNRFCSVHPIRVKLQLARLGRLPQGTEIIVYRLVQECFNNIGKHSHATTVNISAGSADGRVRLQVEDDGVGFKVEEAFARQESFGLSGMRERVALFGGEFEVRSQRAGAPSDRTGKRNVGKRSHGTRISISLPVSSQA